MMKLVSRPVPLLGMGKDWHQAGESKTEGLPGCFISNTSMLVQSLGSLPVPCQEETAEDQVAGQNP